MAEVGRIEIVKKWGTEYAGDGAQRRAEASARAAVQRYIEGRGMVLRGVITIVGIEERHPESTWCFRAQAMGRAVWA